MCCCTWDLHHCLFRYISSFGLSQGQRRALSSFGPGGFFGSLPVLKLGWCWRPQLWLSAPPRACCSAPRTWEHTTNDRWATSSGESFRPSKAPRRRSLQEHPSDTLTEGDVETYDFLLLFLGRVVHVNPLTLVIWLRAETGALPPVCARQSALLAYHMSIHGKWR